MSVSMLADASGRFPCGCQLFSTAGTLTGETVQGLTMCDRHHAASLAAEFDRVAEWCRGVSRAAGA